ncbi:MAG: NUDIX domain-containing protein [Mycobacteriales bacterium]|nr:NUDIX domain-containing protein [Mycobacteriales bacterium]
MTEPSASVRAVSGVLALDADERILLVRRADDGTWGLPGGGVEVGETWLEAAVRECREETGWDVAVTDMFGAYSDPVSQTFTYADGRRVQFFGVVFLATVLQQTGSPDTEVLEVGFFPTDSLPAPLFVPDRPVLLDFASRRHLPVIA